ncbi:MAG TPA: hypothetical protein VHE83_13515 [Mycobacteriales bacterium]|nr:hypothetical protein [Mycobacteriales bacterium]
MTPALNSLLARGAVVALVAGGAIVGSVELGSAAPVSATHTLRFTTVQIADHMSGYYDIAANKDLQNGKVVGYDVTDCFINVNTHVANCVINVARPEGTIRGTATLNLDSGVGTGVITGGTRDYRGVTGTVAAKALSQTKTAVTLTYHS